MISEQPLFRLPLALAAVTCLLLVTFTSCNRQAPPAADTATPEVTDSATPEIIPIRNGNYILKSLNGQPYTGPEVTLRVDGHKISGRAPVNAFNAAHSNGVIGPIAVTRMAGSPERMKLESEFLKYLSSATLSPISSEELAVRTKGIARLIFSFAGDLE